MSDTSGTVQSSADRPGAQCSGCGYALVGLRGDICPECGRPIEAAVRRCHVCGGNLSTSPDGFCPDCRRPCERFTDRVRAMVREANRHAIELWEQRSPHTPVRRWWTWPARERAEIWPFHMLMGLTTGPRGRGVWALEAAGVDPSVFSQMLGTLSPRAVRVELSSDAKLPMHLLAHGALTQAIEEAYSFADLWVGTEHVLLALLASPDPTIKRAIRACGVDAARVRTAAESSSRAQADEGVFNPATDAES